MRQISKSHIFKAVFAGNIFTNEECIRLFFKFQSWNVEDLRLMTEEMYENKDIDEKMYKSIIKKLNRIPKDVYVIPDLDVHVGFG